MLAVASGAYAYSTILENQNIIDHPNGVSIAIESFDPFFIGDSISGGNLTIVNHSDKNFTGLQLTATVDDSAVALINVYTFRPIYAHVSPNRTVPLSLPENFTGIETNQSKNIKFSFANAEISQFSEHTVKFYLSNEKVGDLINGQSFAIQQKKAYLQIVRISPTEHDTDTWHLQYNSTTQKNEYVNDKRNYYQKNHRFFNLPESVFNWSRMLDQIGENYYNVTVLNNNTFPVKSIQFYGGASIDKQTAFTGVPDLLLPNQTCVIPVGGMATPAYSSASGELKVK